MTDKPMTVESNIRVMKAQRAYKNLRDLYDYYIELEDTKDYKTDLALNLWGLCWEVEKLLTRQDSPFYDVNSKTGV